MSSIAGLVRFYDKHITAKSREVIELRLSGNPNVMRALFLRRKKAVNEDRPGPLVSRGRLLDILWCVEGFNDPNAKNAILARRRSI
jgi:hypothetical protein